MCWFTAWARGRARAVGVAPAVAGAKNSAGWACSAWATRDASPWSGLCNMWRAESSRPGCSRIEPEPYWLRGVGSGNSGSTARSEQSKYNRQLQGICSDTTGVLFDATKVRLQSVTVIDNQLAGKEGLCRQGKSITGFFLIGQVGLESLLPIGREAYKGCRFVRQGETGMTT